MRDDSREDWVGLYRKYLQNRDPLDAGECPPYEEIASFFRRRTARRIKYRLLRHIFNCRDCKDEFEWLHELELGTTDLCKDIERLERPAGNSLRRWVWAGMGSAAVLVVLFLVVPARRFPHAHKPIYRGVPQFQFQDVYPPVGAIVHRADLHFSWKPPLPGGSFVLELFDPTMGLLWQSPAITGTETRIPARILRLLKEEQVYFWSVSGIGNDQSIIESPLYSFRFVR